MANGSAKEVIIRYLQDAIAAEKNFESQLTSFARGGVRAEVKAAFEQHARETRTQWERLTERLRALGQEPSGIKSFLAHLFGAAPAAAQVGHDPEEKETQWLIIAFAAENAEIAMYEALATVSAEAADSATERLARSIQREEEQAKSKVWNLLPLSARQSFGVVTRTS